MIRTSVVTYFISTPFAQVLRSVHPLLPHLQQQQRMAPPSFELANKKEGMLILALNAIKLGHLKSTRAAARAYDIPYSTLQERMTGVTSIADFNATKRKLSHSEEQVLSDRIMNLSARGFHPRVSQVGDMTNILLKKRGEGPVVKNWTTNYIKRHSELRARFQKGYDYKRALCEDTRLIEDWFKLVQNIIAKHGILDEDTYNFDEAGFALSVIGTAKVVTSAEYRGTARKL